MSTIIVALIVITAVAGISLLLVYINNKANGKRTKALITHLHQSGMANNLSFSSLELLKNCIIGLDGIQRKLLILKQAEGVYHPCIIHLDEVKNCTVHKNYKISHTSDFKKKKIGEHLEKIVLQFEFADTRQPVEIPFYEQVQNSIFEIPEREQKAKDWETILSKMLTNKLKCPARFPNYESRHWQGF